MDHPNKRLLGKGKARDFTSEVKQGEMLIEEGDQVYVVQSALFFCPSCEGSGCRSCKFTGERQKKDSQNSRKGNP